MCIAFVYLKNREYSRKTYKIMSFLIYLFRFFFRGLKILLLQEVVELKNNFSFYLADLGDFSTHHRDLKKYFLYEW